MKRPLIAAKQLAAALNEVTGIDNDLLLEKPSLVIDDSVTVTISRKDGRAEKQILLGPGDASAIATLPEDYGVQAILACAMHALQIHLGQDTVSKFTATGYGRSVALAEVEHQELRYPDVLAHIADSYGLYTTLFGEAAWDETDDAQRLRRLEAVVRAGGQ